MTWQNCIVAVMLSISFIERVMNIISAGIRYPGKNGISIAALVIVMLWFGALIMILRSGGFW